MCKQIKILIMLVLIAGYAKLFSMTPCERYEILESSQSWDLLTGELRRDIDNYNYDVIDWINSRKTALYALTLREHLYFNLFRNKLRVWDVTQKQALANLLILQEVRLYQERACCNALREKYNLLQPALQEQALEQVCQLFKEKAYARWFSIIQEYHQGKRCFASYRKSLERVKEFMLSDDLEYHEDPSIMLCCSKSYWLGFWASTEIVFTRPLSEVVSLFNKEREMVAEIRATAAQEIFVSLEKYENWPSFFADVMQKQNPELFAQYQRAGFIPVERQKTQAPKTQINSSQEAAPQALKQEKMSETGDAMQLDTPSKCNEQSLLTATPATSSETTMQQPVAPLPVIIYEENDSDGEDY